MATYGRDDFVRGIREASSGVVVIEGDSGIGKSRVLEELGVGWLPSDLVPGARLLGGLRGSLQNALVDEIAEALGGYQFEHTDLVRKTWTAVVEVLNRAPSAITVETSRILLAAVHHAIEKRFGKEFADAAKDLLLDVVRPDDGSVVEHLQSLSVSDLSTQLLAIADQVGISTGSRLVLRVDGAEAMHSEDEALLAELASRPIDTLMIVVGYSTANPARAAQSLAHLEMRGASRRLLEPITDVALRQWLEAEGVPQAQWAAIAQLSTGYPFFVADAVRLSNAGKSLAAISMPNAFGSLLDLTWRNVPTELKAQALTLACFAVRPTDDFIRNHLELAPATWAALRQELVSAGVFVRRPDSSVWFHDRRRNYLWTQQLQSQERAAIADSAIQSLRRFQSSQELIEPWVLGNLSSLMATAHDEAASTAQLGKLTKLDLDELAILFSVIELTEPTSPLGVFADTVQVVNYAAKRFSRPASPLNAIETLRDLGLVVVESNDSASIITLVSPDPLGYAATIAWVGEKLRSTPIPRFGSTMFSSTVGPLANQYVAATVSVGGGAIWDHRQALDSLADPSQGQFVRNTPALGVVATVEGQTLTSTLSFQSIDSRDAAKDRIEAYEKSRGKHEPAIVHVTSFPPPLIRSAILDNVARRLKVDQGLTLLKTDDELLLWLSQRVEAREILRSRLSADDASAIGWLAPYSLVVDLGEQHRAEFDIAMSDAASVRRIRLPEPRDAQDPLLSLRLREAGSLRPAEFITHFSIRASGVPESVKHPVLAVADLFRTRARQFNRSLARVLLEPNELALEQMAATEADLEDEIIEKLIVRGIVQDSPSRTNSRFTYIFFDRDAQWPGWLYNEYEVEDGRRSIVIRIGPPPVGPRVSKFRPQKEVAEALGIVDADVTASGSGVAELALARLLAFGDNEVQLDCPRHQDVATG